ncbi:MAG: hypothetical protein R3B68_13060 [Phycisphaerales bacterium]
MSRLLRTLFGTRSAASRGVDVIVSGRKRVHKRIALDLSPQSDPTGTWLEAAQYCLLIEWTSECKRTRGWTYEQVEEFLKEFKTRVADWTASVALQDGIHQSARNLGSVTKVILHRFAVLAADDPQIADSPVAPIERLALMHVVTLHFQLLINQTQLALSGFVGDSEIVATLAANGHRIMDRLEQIAK